MQRPSPYPRLLPPLLLAAACRAPGFQAGRDLDLDGSVLLDRCPQQPGPASNRGCPPDRDGDGIYDPIDHCPSEPGTVAGCPDQDHFGLLARNDRCPTEQETVNGFQDDDGCPDVAPVQLVKPPTPPSVVIEFKKLSVELSPESQPTLGYLITSMQKYTDLRLEIACHESSSPGVQGRVDPDAVRKFTLRRANTVKKYISASGIDPARLVVRGAGMDEPIDTNETPKGRARNRRCELAVIPE